MNYTVTYRIVTPFGKNDIDIPMTTGRFYCTICKKWFSKRIMKSHFKNRHNIILIAPISEKRGESK